MKSEYLGFQIWGAFTIGSLVLICSVNIFFFISLGLKYLEVFCHQLHAGIMYISSTSSLPKCLFPSPLGLQMAWSACGNAVPHLPPSLRRMFSIEFSECPIPLLQFFLRKNSFIFNLLFPPWFYSLVDFKLE